MGFTIQLQNNDQITSIIVRERIVDHLNKSIIKAIPNIKTSTRGLIEQAIFESEHYKSIVSGPVLKRELGVADGDSKLASIIGVWLRSLRIEFVPFNSFTGTGKFVMTMIKGDFSDVIGRPEARHRAENTGRAITWLDWLLTEGTKDLVLHYEYQALGSLGGRSRTGLGVMVSAPGEAWHVPDKYAGTIEDNWITQTVYATAPLINEKIKEEVKRRFYE